ncbi:hypothetical protein N0V90_001363 [Kalmusia sp. IMI 367209]|nr:hypothetical protein N0V90_001363 [Kalmusia sp. IMI 367209]
MEALDSRQSNLDSVKREEMDYQRKHSASAAITPLHPLSHHNHQSPAASTVPGPLGGLLSPPESRRTSGEEEAQRAPARQSLPSIQEALGSTSDPHAFSAPAPGPPPAPTSAPQSYFPPSTTSPTDQRTRAFSTDLHGSQGSSNPFAQTRSPYMGTSTASGPPPHPPPPAPLDSLPRPSFSEPRPSFSEPRPSFSTPQQNSKLPTLHPLRTNPSPPPGPGRPNYPYNSYPPPSSSTYEPPAPHSAGPMNPNYGYQQYPSNYPLSAPAPGAPNSAYPPSATYSAPPRPYNGQWDGRVEEKKLNRASLAPYGESVKRHLESFDLEASLNEMAEGAGRITDFSKIYRQRAHENQRIGMTPQSMPRLDEVDDMLKHSERIQISLQRMREVVFNHQASIVEPPQYPRMNGYEHDAQSNYGEDTKGAGGFAGPDPKKRRGVSSLPEPKCQLELIPNKPTQRAAPPGRCHSCNRAETPEWRRGPDGARTLCNACGLHYAKLTRKMGGKQAMSSSNLRPKTLEQGSPNA